MAAVRVLEAAGYRVEVLPIADDGRTLLSKGLVRQARKLTEKNMRALKPRFDEFPERKIVGLEPSALLTLRDEAPDLCDEPWKTVARDCAGRARLFEEFVAEERAAGSFEGIWTRDVLPPLLLHGHCHQKALVGVAPTEEALRAAGYEVETLNTGCCGMAGSFGYEANHYDLSMQIGELTLFPQLRNAPDGAAVCAPGTSCRHQIRDGVSKEAEHPAVLLERALK
jgi:Fe-S oxidoreductase